MLERRKITGLVRLMILEEFRMNAAMIGRAQFIFFPVLIMIFALILSISAPVLLKSMSLYQIYLIFHGIFLLYGLGIGGFALFGESIAERRFGNLNLLLESPTIQPIGFQDVFLVFYIKDVIYYILFSMVPIMAGIIISIPFTGFNIFNVLMLFMSIFLTFLFGISLSFFLSTIYVRFKALFAALIIILVGLLAASLFTTYLSIEQVLPSLKFQLSKSIFDLLLTAGFIILFSVIAVKFIKVEFGKRAGRYPPSIIGLRRTFEFTKDYSAYVAKEWLDMKRSRTLYPVVGAYIGPLIFLAIMLWFLKSVLLLPINFNIIFYSAMIGFFGITIYSWLNVLDNPAFYQVLPVGVPRLIKTKLILFFLLSFAISTVFLVILSVLNNQLNLLPLAVPVAYTTTTYTVISTAFLTGLRTNSYLFSPRVLAGFLGMVALPLIFLTIISFLINDHFIQSIVLISIICVILGIGIVFMYRGIENRWRGESFTY